MTGIIVDSGNNIKKLDTYIFPIMFFYCHAVEISLKQEKEYKNNFIKYSLDGISIDKIRLLIKELQEVNQIDVEVNPKKNKLIKMQKFGDI